MYSCLELCALSRGGPQAWQGRGPAATTAAAAAPNVCTHKDEEPGQQHGHGVGQQADEVDKACREVVERRPVGMDTRHAGLACPSNCRCRSWRPPAPPCAAAPSSTRTCGTPHFLGRLLRDLIVVGGLQVRNMVMHCCMHRCSLLVPACHIGPLCSRAASAPQPRALPPPGP